MKEFQHSWNKTLKFSWGHIIAFVAIIFLSYIMYMGCFYSNGGDFTKAAITIGVIDFALILTFIGAQILKGTDSHFKRSLIFERILIILCPIVFLCAMIPYNHFWNVFGERHKIEKTFNSAVTNAKTIFDEYDEYSATRLSNYENVLDSIKSKEGTIDDVAKENYLKTLELQLLSQNTDSITDLATKWIDNSSQGASVWNAFLIGNIDQIVDAIESWNKTLVETSTPVLSNESKYGNEVAAYNGTSYHQSITDLQQLTYIYKQKDSISITTIWTGVILFLMLLLPYLLQNRNSRAKGYYFLIPKRASHKPSDNRNDSVSDDFTDSDPAVNAKPEYNNDDDVFSGTF